MDKEQERYDWLKQKVNPILRKLVVDCVVNEPDDVVFNSSHRSKHYFYLNNSWIS